jgi:hypothetical protein
MTHNDWRSAARRHVARLAPIRAAWESLGTYLASGHVAVGESNGAVLVFSVIEPDDPC